MSAEWLPSINASRAASLSLSLTMLGVTLDTLETLATHREYGPFGVFDPRFRDTSRERFPVLWTWLRRQLRYPGSVLLPVVVLACALSLFVDQRAAAVRLLLIIACTALFRLIKGRSWREGAHVMISVLLVGLSCFYLSPGTWLGEVALVYIGVQTIVTYTASGFAKLVNPCWRDGQALPRILAMDLFQHPGMESFFRRHPWTSRAACWSVLVFECACIPFVFASPWTCAAFLIAGVVFHAFIALTQGLNLFFWAFLATYPVLWLLSRQAHLF